MSILNLNSRPWVVFDAANAEHRAHYSDFLKNNSWGKCPIRFVLTNGNEDSVSMISGQLLNFYTKNEFDKRI